MSLTSLAHTHALPNPTRPAAWQILHGVTLRPPVVSWQGQTYTGARLAALDGTQASQTAGVVGIIQRQNFVGVVASQHHQARRACALLDARWQMPSEAASARLQGETASQANATNAAATTVTAHATPEASDTVVAHSYLWQPPVRPQAETADTVLASFDGQTLSIWAALPGTDFLLAALRAELTHLCQLPPQAIHLYPVGGVDEASAESADTGIETYNTYDAAVDAALMSWQLRRPVKVSAPRHALASQPAAQRIPPETLSGLRVNCSAQTSTPSRAGGQTGTRTAPRFHTCIQNVDALQRPSLAALLCGLECTPSADSTATPGWMLGADTRHETLYAPAHGHHSEAVVAAQVFARESFLDEYWRAQGQDPLRARLDTLQDDTGRALIDAASQRADWFGQPLPAGRGRGFAYAHVLDHRHAPPRHIRSAWIADVRVAPDSGQLELLNVTVAHHVDSREATVRAPALEQAIHETAVRCLPALPGHDDWGNLPSDLQTVRATRLTEVQIARHDIGPMRGSTNPNITTPDDTADGAQDIVLGWHRSAELPATAAIANAIAQAAGVRLRQVPLDVQALQTQIQTQTDPRLRRRSTGFWKRPALWLGGFASAAGSLLLAASPWRAAIPPLAELDTSLYSEQAIARGRLVAIAGDCMVCHTAPGGAAGAGGLALDTPFGTIYSTNITPDRDTGIGTWRYTAFERAMRQGIHQNGKHLYPAFPYTAFAKISDADMQALYAWLMTREPVTYQPPPTHLAFPYNLRFAMAGWNTLFHDAAPYTPDPEQSRLWNRGAYLVQGAGHCGACHTPRNALGAEKTGQHFLGGGLAEGWEAPALNALSKAPIPWTENSLYDYLRTGYSPLHGVAAGPMAPVVHGLAQLPDEDVRAMAHYLATLAAPQANNADTINNTDFANHTSQAVQAARLEQRSRELESVMTLPAERLFDGACAACHDPRDGPPLFGTRPSLALNTNLHSDLPDNVIQVLLHGIPNPALPNLGYMPGFKDSLNDAQLLELLTYMRQRFAPDKPAWQNLPEKIRAIRQMAGPE